jgi:hypothetical protein
MSLFTSSYLRNVYNNRTVNLVDGVRRREYARAETASFDIFLCHSFLDKEIIGGLYTELTRQGYSVYVDWVVDPHLDRDNVTKESAELIRTRLKNSKSLLLAVSTNANLSKWMPWELGYVDGHTNNCALVPIETNNMTVTSFNRREYLLLYPYVKRNGDFSTLYVAESNNTYSTFQDWVKYKTKPRYNMNSIY